MSPTSELEQLARLITGEPRAALRRVLLLLCEQLGMDAAFVATVDHGQREIRVAVEAGGEDLPGAVGVREELAQTWCGRVVDGETLLLSDGTSDARLLALPSTRAFAIVSYAGVVVRDHDGALLGTLCAIGHVPHTSLNDRDTEVLRALSRVVAPLLRALDGPVVPTQRRTGDLASVADTVVRAQDVEELSRPLLAALHDLTGLASTYLTVIHEETTQELRYTHNTSDGFTMPEGLVVPWADTLCKRALDEGKACTTDVPDVWGDSEAAQALGIQTYVSVPVSLSDGQVWGTLCGADGVQRVGAADHLPTMRLFATLIASEVERSAAVARAQRARQEADTDALTGCAARRVLEPWLDTNLRDLEADEAVLVAYVDVDAFKAVNDGLGHAAGDAALVEVGRRLRGAARPGDLVARLGGDEFVVAARLPRGTDEVVATRVRDAVAFDLQWLGAQVAVRCSVGSAVSVKGDTGAVLLARADAAMYARKAARG